MLLEGEIVRFWAVDPAYLIYGAESGGRLVSWACPLRRLLWYLRTTGAYHHASAPAEYSVHRGRRLWLCRSWLHRPDRLPDPLAGPARRRGDPLHSGLCQ